MRVLSLERPFLAQLYLNPGTRVPESPSHQRLTLGGDSGSCCLMPLKVKDTHTPLAQLKTQVYLLNRITERKSHSQEREGFPREEKTLNYPVLVLTGPW